MWSKDEAEERERERRSDKTKRSSAETTNGRTKQPRDRWRTPAERKRKRDYTTCFGCLWRGGGGNPPARLLQPPLLSLYPYLLSRPDTGTPSLGFLSLTLFLSLPVCMVKYCIIVLTAGRKTAQPVVAARRVARIRAACTHLCRILGRPLRRTKYRVA